MAHFALVNSDGIVETVQVINNDVLDGDGDFPDSEVSGQQFQASLGLAREGAVWLQTSYNNNFRFNYAAVGYSFDPDKGTNGAFIPPKPFESWVLDEDTCLWVSPVEYPADGAEYVWDEQAGNWSEVTGD